jgi:NAD(P)-dependent dehydrogenase (short-subunit alcohol dehydrogenase family)
MAKVAAVLGVGPGLGAAVARRFAREGFDIALMARSRGALDASAKEIGALGRKSVAIEVDATSAASVADGFSKARAALGDASVFVYNAGAFKIGEVTDVSPDDFDACWRANCAGAFYAAKHVVPPMLAAGEGTILLTGATASLRGSARFSCLAVGKFGLRALAQSMARELGPRGVHVAHVVIDGQIDTPRLRAMSPDRDPKTMLAPDAIAETYWQLHAQPRSTWTLEIDLRPNVEKF